jgi:hypothetical protein
MVSREMGFMYLKMYFQGFEAELRHQLRYQVAEIFERAVLSLAQTRENVDDAINGLAQLYEGFVLFLSMKLSRR